VVDQLREDGCKDQSRYDTTRKLNMQPKTAEKGWSINYERTGVETNSGITQQVKPMFKEYNCVCS